MKDKFKNSKKRKLIKALKAAKLEIDRLSSKNTVLVQSIQFAIKEANLVLLANNNGKPSTVCDDGFYVEAGELPFEAQSKPKERIPISDYKKYKPEDFKSVFE